MTGLPGAARVRCAWLAAGLALAALAACSQGAKGPAADSGGASDGPMLVRGGGPDPDSLDPQKVRGAEAQLMVRDLCEGLTTLDHNAAVAPGVASRWSVSADGKVYTFTLRPEARWSNGDQVVAADFVA